MAWTISGSQILTFWTDIWPKVVALAWLDEAQGSPKGTPYRRVFEEDNAFRINEAHRIAKIIGVRYDSNIPLCPAAPAELGIPTEAFFSSYPPHPSQCIEIPGWTDDDEKPRGFAGFSGWSCPSALWGETYFLINNGGFVLPWPRKPSDLDMYVGYLEGGGILPRLNPPYRAVVGPVVPPPSLPPGPAGPQLAEREYLFLTQIKDWSVPTGFVSAGRPDRCDTRYGLSGVSLITLIEKWPKIQAQAWYYASSAPPVPSVLTIIQNDLEDHVMPEVWSQWPAGVTANWSAAQDDIVLNYPGAITTAPLSLDMILPVPDRRGPMEDHIFEELIVGHATNPMYSNCY